MNFTLWHRASAFIVFTISSIIFLMTVAPTLSFWDCGEFITAAVTMSIPHPPGAPFFQLVGRIFSLLPFGDIGFRVNLISSFSSSLTVLFVYLVIMRLLRMWQGEPKSTVEGVIMILAAATGALILSFSDTFWFNASEAEVYGIGMFFISAVVWIALEWYAHAGVFDSERSLLLIAYLMGLSIGVHLLSLLALFFVFVLIYFRGRRKEDITVKSVVLFLLLSGIGFSVIYPGIVKYIPEILSGKVGPYFLLILVGVMIFIIASKKLHDQLRMVCLSVMLVTLGYSTYTLVPIRASQKPALNENDPSNLKTLYSYLNREQYGSYPILKGPNYDDRTRSITNVPKFLPRRWNHDNVSSYANYSSDFDYFLRFQFGHIYFRYFLWNFVGRAGDIQDAPVAFIGDQGNWSESQGYPNRYYAIPLVLGLLGLWFHFKKDWKTGTATAVLFFMTGVGLVIYFNMADPQVRERDYFFIGSFYVFTIWCGVGVFALWSLLKERFAMKEVIGVGLAAVLFVVGPINMLSQNYQTHTRHYNYVAFDYAYNLLQSCDQDAILFTGGDNDTFPVWYLQYVAGIRRDIRVVNLSLVNTNWYSKQLKNERPYGALPVELSYTDQELDMMRPVAWEERQMSIPVDVQSIDLSSMNDVPFVQAQLEIPQSLEFTVQPTYRDPEGTPGIRNQDILIIDILTKNLSKRPIYFALSTAPTDRIGLDEHLIVEGLAARVTPFKFPMRGDRYYPNVNIPVTRRHVLNPVSVADSNRAFGFMFRELNNPHVNLDEASTKMIMSYRYLFMGLAQVIYQDMSDKAGAAEVLDKMNKVMPPAYHRFDETLKTDMSTMYYLMNDTARFLEAANELEAYFLKELERDITGRSSVRSPYSILLNIYEMRKEYQKAIDILRRYQQVYPNDQSVQAQIQNFERMLRGEQGVAPDTAAAGAIQ